MRSAAEVFPETVSEAASAFSAGIGFTAGSRVVLQGARTVLSYRVEAEAERRRQVGMEPIGSPVPMAALTGPERSILRSAPRGALSVQDGSVVRLAEPPIQVGLAMVPARSWRRGLERAGRFAPARAAIA